jgi:hypothetical protein
LAGEKVYVFTRTLAGVNAAMLDTSVKVYSAQVNTKRQLIGDIEALVSEAAGAPTAD